MSTRWLFCHRWHLCLYGLPLSAFGAGRTWSFPPFLIPLHVDGYTNVSAAVVPTAASPWMELWLVHSVFPSEWKCGLFSVSLWMEMWLVHLVIPSEWKCGLFSVSLWMEMWLVHSVVPSEWKCGVFTQSFPLNGNVACSLSDSFSHTAGLQMDQRCVAVWPSLSVCVRQTLSSLWLVSHHWSVTTGQSPLVSHHWSVTFWMGWCCTPWLPVSGWPDTVHSVSDKSPPSVLG